MELMKEESDKFLLLEELYQTYVQYFKGFNYAIEIIDEQVCLLNSLTGEITKLEIGQTKKELKLMGKTTKGLFYACLSERNIFICDGDEKDQEHYRKLSLAPNSLYLVAHQSNGDKINHCYLTYDNYYLIVQLIVGEGKSNDMTNNDKKICYERKLVVDFRTNCVDYGMNTIAGNTSSFFEQRLTEEVSRRKMYFDLDNIEKDYLHASYARTFLHPDKPVAICSGVPSMHKNNIPVMRQCIVCKDINELRCSIGGTEEVGTMLEYIRKVLNEEIPQCVQIADKKMECVTNRQNQNSDLTKVMQEMIEYARGDKMPSITELLKSSVR